MQDYEFLRATPQHEIRVIMEMGQTITIWVDDGDIFHNNWQLPPTEPVIFKNRSFTLSTYERGCTIKYVGTFTSMYIAPISDHFPDHQSLGGKAVVAICGPPSTGKTTICKYVINSAMASANDQNKEHPMIYCNLDPAQAIFAPYGSIGALPLTSSVDNNGWPDKNPLVYFFGHTRINEENTSRYSDLVTELALHVKRRRDAFVGSELGAVLDLPAPTDNSVLAGISTAITQFGVTHIYTVGDDRLYRMFKTSFPTVQVFRMPTLGAAVVEEKAMKLKTRNIDTKRYFEGDDTSDLISMTYKFSRREDFKVYSINQRESSLVELSETMLNSLVAIVPKPSVEAELWQQNALGFLVITIIKSNEEEIEVLKPKQDFPPDCVFVCGSVKYSIK